MTRLNLEQQTLAINLCELNDNNAARVARILSQRVKQHIDPGVVRRVLRKNHIEVNPSGRPSSVDDEELRKYFNKYAPNEEYISHAAEKTAKKLGYVEYRSVIYRWKKLGLI